MPIKYAVDILAIGAHPDDIELSCSGTLLKHKALGYSIGLIDLTMGQLGSRGTSELRLEEAKMASKILGATFRHNLRWEDGFFEGTQDHLIDLIKEIRNARPKIILANAIQDRHPDHGRASTIIDRAAFLSGLVKIETSYRGMHQQPHRPSLVLHYIQDRFVQPDLVFDITKNFEEKMSAISCYASQFYSSRNKGPDTPISTKDFWDYIEAKDRYYGRMIHCKYGEGFTSERVIGVQELNGLI